MRLNMRCGILAAGEIRDVYGARKSHGGSMGIRGESVRLQNETLLQVQCSVRFRAEIAAAGD